jgi:cytochrome c
LDSQDFNTYAGWGLAAVLSVLVLNVGSGMLFHPAKPVKPGYEVQGVEAEATDAAPAAAADKPMAFYLTSASADKGAEIFKKCATCHSIEKGAPAGIGPNLYGVLGGPHAHMQGFAYSDAMMATHGKTWDWDSLNEWLKSPKAYIPGNKMSFAGISKPEDRAAVAMYLNKMSDKPLPMPAAPAADAPAADAKPAEAAKPAA